jgi:hypothetical protein
MISKILPPIIVTAFLLQGCASQLITEHFAKGDLVREEFSGKVLGLSKTPTIELVSPCSVSLRERVERQEETTLYYQKLLVKKKATPRKYPYLDAYFKVLLSTGVIPVFTPSFWVQGSYAGPDCSKDVNKCDVRDISKPLRGQYFTETGSRTLVEEGPPAESGNVSVFMNGYYRGDVAAEPEGTVRIALLQLPEALDPDRDLKITFKYFNVYAYSLIKRADLASARESCQSGKVPGQPQAAGLP